MAQHDGLTGLPNAQSVASADGRDAVAHAPYRREASRCSASTSTTSRRQRHARPSGRRRAAAARWRAACAPSLREDDTIARLGGDEFAIVQTPSRPARGRRAAGASGSSTRSASPTISTATQVVVGASIGIALAPGDGDDADTPAEECRHGAVPRQGATARGSYRFFEPEMDARVQARRALEIGPARRAADERVRAATTSRWWICADRRSAPASRRWCAGSIPSAA